MSMHTDHHPSQLSSELDGSVWPAFWVVAAVLGLATMAWALS